MLFQCWLGSLKNMLLSPFPKAFRSLFKKKKKKIYLTYVCLAKRNTTKCLDCSSTFTED